jgi:hypothetical protein
MYICVVLYWRVIFFLIGRPIVGGVVQFVHSALRPPMAYSASPG